MKKIFKIAKLGWVLLAITALSGCNNVQQAILNKRVVESQKKETALHSDQLSAKSVSIYETFYKKMVPVALSLSENKTFSLVDAFVNLALLSKTSGPDYQNDVLSFYSCSQAELDTAAKEILLSLAVPDTCWVEGQEKAYGGFALNSLWIRPEIALKEDQTTLSSLKNDYFADLFHAEATADAINAYNQAMTPAVYGELPKVNFEDPLDCAIVSTFDVYNAFSEREENQNREDYASGKHKMSFFSEGGAESLKNYLSNTQYWCKEKIGDGFTGVDNRISHLGFSLYKADEGQPLSKIIKDAVEGIYTYRDYGLDEQGKAIIPVCTSKIPYFEQTTDLELMPIYAQAGLSSMSGSSQGALSKVIQDETQSVVFIKQSNVCSLDYEGFVSKSITITGTNGTAATSINGPSEPTYYRYDYDANKPFLFSVNKDVRVGTDFQNLPILYGTMMDPEYV